MLSLSTCILAAALLAAPVAPTVVDPIADTPFVQEYHEAYPLEGSANDVRAILADSRDIVWVATDDGVFCLKEGRWHQASPLLNGAAYDLAETEDGLWVAAWDGLYCINNGAAKKVEALKGIFSVVAPTNDGLVALGVDGSWRMRNGEWSAIDANWSRNLRDAVCAPDGSLWVGTWMGLYHLDNQNNLRRFFEPEDVFSGAIYSLAFAPDGRLWAGSWGGITVLENSVCVNQITGEQGLPNWDVHCVAFAPDGTMWAGTALGVARYADNPEWIARNNGSKWSLRHSKRWLLSDNVRDISFDSNGNAWIATNAGVSAIKRRMMTLADKAAYYNDILLKRHVRAPWLVEKCTFPDPNDTSKWEPMDDDNDGEYTAAYMMTECFRYAVTKDPEAKLNADRAYEAIEFFQKVTETDGFFARTVVPITWEKMHDMNETLTPEEVAERRVHDPRWKPVGERWRKSSDGKWWWKGDTSSDEMNGHMMGYYAYWTLVAEGERKARVAQHIDNIMMHVINNNYTLVDPIDGKATRWGVWTPEIMLNDPDWWVEGHINIYETMAYLRMAHEVTGKKIYIDEYNKFLQTPGYLERMQRPKAHRRSEWSHIDDGMIFEMGQMLIDCETDPALRALYMEGITWSYRMVENDQNPYFNFAFGLLGGENFHLEESVEFLRDQPLDTRQWRIDNSKRDDIRWTRSPMQEPLQTHRMLPPSERGVMRWDKNPWSVISGDFSDPQGTRESSGVFWLMPYWMGRYAGFIAAP